MWTSSNLTPWDGHRTIQAKTQECLKVNLTEGRSCVAYAGVVVEVQEGGTVGAVTNILGGLVHI